MRELADFILPIERFYTAAGSSVKEKNGLAFRISAFFPIYGVKRRYFKHPAVIWFRNLRIECFMGRVRFRNYVHALISSGKVLYLCNQKSIFVSMYKKQTPWMGFAGAFS
jgi:hypothetical protein